MFQKLIFGVLSVRTKGRNGFQKVFDTMIRVNFWLGLWEGGRVARLTGNVAPSIKFSFARKTCLTLKVTDSHSSRSYNSTLSQIKYLQLHAWWAEKDNPIWKVAWNRFLSRLVKFLPDLPSERLTQYPAPAQLVIDINLWRITIATRHRLTSFFVSTLQPVAQGSWWKYLLPINLTLYPIQLGWGTN